MLHEYSVTYAYRGQAWLEGKKNYKSAIEDSTKAIKYYRREGNEHLSGPAILQRAKAYESVGNIRAALNDFERALKIDANDTEAKNGVARLSSSDTKRIQSDQTLMPGTPEQPATSDLGGSQNALNSQMTASTDSMTVNSWTSNTVGDPSIYDNYLGIIILFTSIAILVFILILTKIKYNKPSYPADHKVVSSAEHYFRQETANSDNQSKMQNSNPSEVNQITKSRLESLRDSGVLTEDEFNQEMQRARKNDNGDN
jgi:tetratricopeptide (TPR) repeat protein